MGRGGRLARSRARSLPRTASSGAALFDATMSAFMGLGSTKPAATPAPEKVSAEEEGEGVPKPGAEVAPAEGSDEAASVPTTQEVDDEEEEEEEEGEDDPSDPPTPPADGAGSAADDDDDDEATAAAVVPEPVGSSHLEDGVDAEAIWRSVSDDTGPLAGLRALDLTEDEAKVISPHLYYHLGWTTGKKRGPGRPSKASRRASPKAPRIFVSPGWKCAPTTRFVSPSDDPTMFVGSLFPHTLCREEKPAYGQVLGDLQPPAMGKIDAWRTVDRMGSTATAVKTFVSLARYTASFCGRLAGGGMLAGAWDAAMATAACMHPIMVCHIYGHMNQALPAFAWAWMCVERLHACGALDADHSGPALASLAGKGPHTQPMPPAYRYAYRMYGDARWERAASRKSKAPVPVDPAHELVLAAGGRLAKWWAAQNGDTKPTAAAQSSPKRPARASGASVSTPMPPKKKRPRPRAGGSDSAAAVAPPFKRASPPPEKAE